MKIIKKTILFVNSNPMFVGILLSFICLCSFITIAITNPELMETAHGAQGAGLLLLAIASLPFCVFVCGLICLFFCWIWERLVNWAESE